MKYPAVVADLAKLRHNALLLKKRCEQAGIRCFVVTKGVGAHERVVRTLFASGIRCFADSRLQNIRSVYRCCKEKCNLLLLRLPAQSEAEEVVRYCDMSLNSELSTIVKLGEAASRAGKQHAVILMVELGDLREGMMPEQAVEISHAIKRIPGIRLAGLGANFTCYGGVIPKENAMNELTRLTDRVERIVGHRLEYVSGGNSSTLPLLFEKKALGRVNHLRIGEAVYVGRETAYGKPIPGCYTDVFMLAAEIVELQCKPSMPQGDIGRDAFGNIPRFVDRGNRVRAILAIGKQDVDIGGLRPVHPGARILGASSDHLLIDVTDSDPLHVGDTMYFYLSYGALLQLMTSSYVYKEFVHDAPLSIASEFSSGLTSTTLRSP